MILPNPLVISDEALARLKTFAQSGGRVLFLGGTPKWSAGRTIRDAKEATPADFSWATVVGAQVPSTPTPPQFPPAAPPEPLAVPAAILTALHSVVPAPSVHLDTADPALKVMTRRLKDADVYLFFNEGAQPCDREVTLATHGHILQSWNPQTATVDPVAFARYGSDIVVHLKLQPYETRVLVVR